MSIIANWFKEIFNQWSGNVIGYLVYISNTASAIDSDTTNIDNKLAIMQAHTNIMQAKLTNLELNSYRTRYASSFRSSVGNAVTLNATKIRITIASGITTDIALQNAVTSLASANDMALLAMELKAALGRSVNVEYQLVGTDWKIFITNVSVRVGFVSVLNASNVNVLGFNLVTNTSTWDIT